MGITDEEESQVRRVGELLAWGTRWSYWGVDGTVYSLPSSGEDDGCVGTRYGDLTYFRGSLALDGFRAGLILPGEAADDGVLAVVTFADDGSPVAWKIRRYTVFPRDGGRSAVGHLNSKYWGRGRDWATLDPLTSASWRWFGSADAWDRATAFCRRWTYPENLRQP